MRQMHFRSVRSRMILLVTAVLAFVLVFFAVLVSSNLREIADREMAEKADATLTQAALHLEYLQSGIRTLAVQIAGDPTVQSCFPTESTYDAYRIREQLSRVLRGYMTQTDYLVGINLIYGDGRTYSTARQDPAGIHDHIDRASLDALLDEERSGFAGMVELDYQGYTHVPAVAYAMRVNNYLINAVDYATLVLFIRPEYFTRQLAEGFATASVVALTDADGGAIYEKRAQDSGRDGLSLQKALPSGWTLAVDYPQGPLMSRYRTVVGRLILLVLAFAAVMTAVILTMIRRWTAPIQQLTEMTRQVSEGNLDVRPEYISDDEIGQLTLAFSGMTENLKRNMDRRLEEEKARNRMQMELQLARINPHFIYNTLDSVIWLARMGRTDEMIGLCRVFVAILQDTLHTDGEHAAATLRREIEIVRDYEAIQAVRYEGRFTIEYHLDPEAEDALVPKLLLQPIVENALYHGILPDESKPGTIVIETRAEGDRVSIEISDDGMGMSPEVLANLNSPDYVGVKSQLHSIGLSNLRKRLELMYPGAHTFRLSGGRGRGTRIAITVPNAPKKEE